MTSGLAFAAFPDETLSKSDSGTQPPALSGMYMFHTACNTTPGHRGPAACRDPQGRGVEAGRV